MEFLVSDEFIREALEMRFEFVKGYSWGKDVPDELKELFINLVCEQGIIPKDKTAGYLVDNFLINGRWGYLEDFEISKEQAKEAYNKGDFAALIELDDDNLIIVEHF